MVNINRVLINTAAKQANELLAKLLEVSSDVEDMDDLTHNIASALTAAVGYVTTVCSVVHEMLTYGLDQEEKEASRRQLANLISLGIVSILAKGSADQQDDQPH